MTVSNRAKMKVLACCSEIVVIDRSWITRHMKLRILRLDINHTVDINPLSNFILGWLLQQLNRDPTSLTGKDYFLVHL